MDGSGLIPWKWQRYLVSIVLTCTAAALRVWPLAVLESRLAWLTFYPAVMIAAIYGGISAGLLTTGLASIIVIFFWPFLVAQPFIKDSADMIGLGVFILTSTMISAVAEMMRRANIRAKKAQEDAESANQAKSLFLSNMSHELRTPLNAILGFSTLMRNDTSISEEHRKTLDIINRSGENLLSLINDVLDMAKIEAGSSILDLGPFDLSDLIRDIIDLMTGRAVEKGVDLIQDQSSEFPRFVRGDFAKIRQIIINLVGNAIKFTPEGEVTLRLHAQPLDISQRILLIIEVQDSGVGISPEDQIRIFDPFIQVTDLTFQKGTGLGLTITRKFVELMGGHITLESSVGHGSLFRVEIPVDLTEESDVNKISISHGRVIGLVPGQDEFRILIVEDQIENWLLLKRMLEDVGLSTRVAGNGQEGIDGYLFWHPHLILMDLRMPVMDGLESARRIRTMEGGGEVKIVALTASVFREERDNVMAAGMDDFIRKPYRPEEIFDCLTRLVGVQFVEEHLFPESTNESLYAINQEDVIALPLEIREELHDALVSLDTSGVADIVKRISDMNQALGSALRYHADHLMYTALLRECEISLNAPLPEEA